MRGHETQDQKAITREMFVQQAACDNANFSASQVRGDMVSRRIERDCSLESTVEEGSCEPVLLPMTPADATKLVRALQHLEAMSKREPPRIAFKAKGTFLFLELAEIVAVQAQGNYVSLEHVTSPYLLREPLSSMAEKLKPYGFIRIHRSVLVNTSAVEQIQSLPTGEYKLRIKGGKEYLVTRTYKTNLRCLAQLWVGWENLCNERG